MPTSINEELIDFIAKSPTAYQAAGQVRRLLVEAGYTELTESQPWQLTTGGKYFCVRNESALIAFRIPSASCHGYMISASHSDSPTFRIKEHAEMEGNGYVRLNTEGYGGMLMAPWLDRPLSIAGRLIIRDGSHYIAKSLVIDDDLLLIPNLAIHMDRKANQEKAYNAQVDTIPLYGLAQDKGTFMDMIARYAGVSREDIAGDDLFLYNRQRGLVWGTRKQFLSAPRLDDLQCAFGCLQGFITSSDSASLPVYALFDNEEVGSLTKQGADSTFLYDVLSRIEGALNHTEATMREHIASSFMVSADNAHAIHPNHPEKADPTNQPALNGGIVIKYAANQHYTTDGLSAAVFKDICRKADVPCQIFTNRSDSAGGSTLGNISNAHVSLNTVDIGLPQLAMHSPFETAGALDTESLVRAMRQFFSSSFIDEGQGRFSLQ